MFTLTRKLSTLYMLLACGFISPLVMANDMAVKLEHFKWFGQTPKAKLVRVINPFGGISTRNTSYDSIEISGIIQKIGANPGQHKIDITDNNGVTEVVVSYPQGNKNANGQLTGRFDLGVWIPAWVNVELVTDFGDIKAKKHGSNIVAQTVSGKIKIGGGGTVDAKSDSGNITVDLYGERFKQQMSLSSKTGDVKVNLSQTAKVTLWAQSNQAVKHNLNDYKAIKVTEFGEHEFKAQLAYTDPKVTELQLTAEQGVLSVNIAKKASHKLRIGERLSAFKPQILTKTPPKASTKALTKEQSTALTPPHLKTITAN